MAQNLKELDRLMTPQAFADQTGIDRYSSIAQVKQLFAGIDIGDVFPHIPFHLINVKQSTYIGTFYLTRLVTLYSEDAFLEKLYSVKHIITYKRLLKLCRSLEKFILYYKRRWYLNERGLLGGDDGDLYNNVAFYYGRICSNEMDDAVLMIRKLLLATQTFEQMNALLDRNLEFVRRENTWQRRRGLAIFRESVVLWFKKPKIERQQFIATPCEIVIHNTNFRRHLASYF